MIEFELMPGVTAVVGDTRICSHCGSLNIHDADDAPEGVVECSDCGMEDYPDEMVSE